jgi:hypothetical protein
MLFPLYMFFYEIAFRRDNENVVSIFRLGGLIVSELDRVVPKGEMIREGICNPNECTNMNELSCFTKPKAIAIQEFW